MSDPINIPPQLTALGAAKIAQAQAGFATIVSEFGGANIIAQITTAGKTKLIADTMKDVVFYGSIGSLWEAYVACERIKITPEMYPYLTEDRKQFFKNRLIEAISKL